jgi:hypothetical protein
LPTSALLLEARLEATVQIGDDRAIVTAFSARGH